MNPHLVYGDGQVRPTCCISREDGKRCRRRARYFGRFAGGGLCFLHVDLPDQLHQDDREAYLVESEKRVTRGNQISTIALSRVFFNTRGGPVPRSVPLDKHLEAFAKRCGCTIIECDPDEWGGGGFGYTTADAPNTYFNGYKTRRKAFQGWLQDTFGKIAGDAVLGLLRTRRGRG